MQRFACRMQVDNTRVRVYSLGKWFLCFSALSAASCSAFADRTLSMWMILLFTLKPMRAFALRSRCERLWCDPNSKTQDGLWCCSTSLMTRLSSAGEFFVPCWGNDFVCLRRYEAGKKAGTWNMTRLVGRHWFSGSWNKPWLINKELKPASKARHLSGFLDGNSMISSGQQW